MSTEIVQKENEQPEVITKPADDKIVINHMQVNIRSIDRSFKDIAAYWNALQTAENVYYPNRADLYDIYATVLKDGHLWGIIDKRIKNTINKKIQFKVGGKKIDAFDNLIKTKKFKKLRKKRFTEITHGIYGFEFIPGQNFDFKVIPVKHISPERGLIINEQWGDRGLEYEGVWNIIVQGEADEFGLLDKCCAYAIWKKGNMGDWAEYIEEFGRPMIIFTYNAHDIKTKQELDGIMANMGGGTRLQIPDQVKVDVKDGKTSNGNGELQDKIRRACNEEMSVVVLGVTETTGSSKSSGYAQSETQAFQQDEIIKADMDDELAFLNSDQFLNVLKSYGFPVKDGCFSYVDVIDPDIQKKELEIDKTLEDIGVPLGHDYYYEKYGRPKPANYNEIVKEKAVVKKSIIDPPVEEDTDDEPDDENNGKAAKKANKKEAKALSLLQRMQASLANFFDPAP
jgi:hypothetical protein